MVDDTCKTIIIIQARMGSSRLPGKILLPLDTTIVLDYVVSRCKQVKHIADVIVATSVLEQDNSIADWCEQQGVTCFRGSEDDVLDRYYQCAKPYNPDYVIRVTSDCPFVDYELANQVISAVKETPADNVLIDGELPRGLVVEMVSFRALEYIHQNGHEPRHREHVTYFAYEYPKLFQSVTIEASPKLRYPQLRITLDTEEDYQLCKAIAEKFSGNKLVSATEVVTFLMSNPDIAKINAHVQQKPVV